MARDASSCFFLGGCLRAFGSGFDLGFAREAGLILGGEGGISASAGISTTDGNPECGPRKFRIEEKCSQS